MTRPTITDAQALERQQPGWLLPYLLELDTLEMNVPAGVEAPGKETKEAYHFKGHGRWTYWLTALGEHRLPDPPIPQINWLSHPRPQDERQIQQVLTYRVQNGYVSYSEAWTEMVYWLLYGFNYRPNELQSEIERVPGNVRAYWYRHFNLANLLNSPCDWSAHILQNGLPRTKGNHHNRWQGSGFYATPMPVIKMMAAMTWGDDSSIYESFYEPAAGTGSILLVASNYSLRLYGTELVADLVMCCVLNGYLFAPWMVLSPDWVNDLMAQETGTVPPAPVNEIGNDMVDLSRAAQNGDLEQLSLFG